MATADWADPADDGRQMAAARRYSESMAPFSASGVYVNNLGFKGDDRVRAAYGPLTCARLQQLKYQYDPRTSST